MIKNKFDIIVLLDTTFSFVDLRVVRTIKMLQKNNYSVCLLCYHDDKFPAIDYYNDILIHRFMSYQIESPKSIISLRKKEAKRIVDEYSFKAVFCNDHTMLNVGVLIKQIQKESLLIYDSHEFFQDYQFGFKDSDSWIIKLKSKIWVNIQRRKERKDIKQADIVVTINDSIGDIYNKKFTPKKPVITVKNIPDHYLDAKGLTLDAKMLQLLEEIKDKKNLLYIGNYIEKLNGLETVLYALQERKDVNLILLGRSKSPQYFNSLYTKLNISSQIKVIDQQPVELIPQVAKYCQVAIIPTMESGILQNYLSLPNKFFDSIKLSLPIICTNLPEQKKIIEKFSNGILTDPFDSKKATEEIINAIDHIYDNMDKFKEAALKANDFFNFEDEYEKLINKIDEHLRS